MGNQHRLRHQKCPVFSHLGFLKKPPRDNTSPPNKACLARSSAMDSEGIHCACRGYAMVP